MSAYWIYFADDELLRAIAADEAGAREEFARRYADPVYDFCARMTGDQAGAAAIAAHVLRREVRQSANAPSGSVRTAIFATAYAECGAEAPAKAAHALHRYGLSDTEVAAVVASHPRTVHEWIAHEQQAPGITANVTAPNSVRRAILETPPAITITVLGRKRRSRIAVVLGGASIAVLSAFGIARALETGTDPEAAPGRRVVGFVTTTTESERTTESTPPVTFTLLPVPSTETTVEVAEDDEEPDSPSTTARRPRTGTATGSASAPTGAPSAPPPPAPAPTDPPATPAPTAPPATTAPPTSRPTTTTTTTTTTTPPPAAPPLTANPSEVLYDDDETVEVVLTRTNGVPGVEVLVIAYITGEDPGYFFLDENDCNAESLDVGESCSVEVRAARSSRNREAILRFETTAGDRLDVRLFRD